MPRVTEITGSVRVSLGEGNTPLIQSRFSSSRASALWFKLESCNPTGSYKDRFVASELSLLAEKGGTSLIATSSGNTGASLAAYSARCGIKCLIAVNADAPTGKLAQMQAYGAQVLAIPGFVSDAYTSALVFEMLNKVSTKYSIPLVVSAFRYCAEGMRGVEAIAAELQPLRPDHVFVPVGGGGLYSAVVQGFLALSQRPPRVHAVQPEGCLTLVGGYLRDDTSIPPVQSTTKISGLSVPTDLDANRGLKLLRQCNGTGISVSDEEIYDAQRILALEEGVYSEPAGATAFAGYLRAVKTGIVVDGESSVCLVTGHGFKDRESIERLAAENPPLLTTPVNIEATLSRLLEGIE